MYSSESYENIIVKMPFKKPFQRSFSLRINTSQDIECPMLFQRALFHTHLRILLKCFGPEPAQLEGMAAENPYSTAQHSLVNGAGWWGHGRVGTAGMWGCRGDGAGQWGHDKGGDRTGTVRAQSQLL